MSSTTSKKDRAKLAWERTYNALKETLKALGHPDGYVFDRAMKELANVSDDKLIEVDTILEKIYHQQQRRRNE